MNRSAFSVSLLLILSLPALCQDKRMDKKQRDIDAPADNYRRVEFELGPLRHKIALLFPVSAIEVLDLRQDTSKFGYYGPGSLISPFKQFCFTNGAAADINSFLSNSFNPGSTQPGQKLLYCLKKCWITNADSVDKNTHRSASNNSKLYFKAELYYEKDSTCYPLYRFDSVFNYKRQAGPSSIRWLEEALVISLEKLNGLTPEKVVKRNSLQRSEINGYYADEKHTVITSVPAPAKGVYLSFAEFKNNQPSYTAFEISYEKTVDMMRVKEPNGDWTIIKKDWGYSDGAHLFIRIEQNYFRLFKTGDTYELNGSELMDIVQPGGSYFTPDGMMHSTPGTYSSSSGLALGRLKPLQLDMETGKVFY